jgi:hypothetical protein
MISNYDLHPPYFYSASNEARTEVPRIAGAFGLEATTRANVTSAVYAVQAAVNTTQTIVKAVSK